MYLNIRVKNFYNNKVTLKMNKMNKAIKLNTPFETIRFSNTTPEGKLRKAIIIQAI